MALQEKKYRLVTRGDFDGLICGVLLKELDLIDGVQFAHPKDMQDGKVEITSRDIITNLPFVPGCYMAFDHHQSEVERTRGLDRTRYVLDPKARSAARIVYDHFGGKEKFPRLPPDMMDAVDRADSGQFTKEDVLNPQGWVLLNFLVDARTGLGRFRDFRLSTHDLMLRLIDQAGSLTIDEILDLPDVRERAQLYRKHQWPFEEQIRRCSKLIGELVVLDLRPEETIYCGNRFAVYALHLKATVSMHVMWGKQKQNTVFAIGKSIFNRDSTIDIGRLCFQFGGGGHRNAGTCQIENSRAPRVMAELTEILAREG